MWEVLQVPIDLNSFANGAVAERFDEEFERVLENMSDLNTDPKKPRTITLTLTITGDKKREVWDCQVQAKSKLAPTIEVGSKILMERDENGQIVGQELASGVKGQYYIDLEGDVANDVGEKVVHLQQ
ncbi:replication terminator protein [Bacillus thuringiensis]|nr:replication terminator protein [Bacillus thuringiensis]MEB8712021.1 replication terminator protein [Bacillus cereus]MED1158732.1 replication terminator protein [Bacillus paranthracis]MEB4819662.1 replication terminator protein [Bacillus thuringiensis]MEB4894527.1 replication terminator protein [Bacillus thuringiensis]MEB8859223.1 replication terminator protein [Bacillus cereus]